MARVLCTHGVTSHLSKTLLSRQLRKCGKVIKVAIVGSIVEDCIPRLRRGVGLEGASMLLTKLLRPNIKPWVHAWDKTIACYPLNGHPCQLRYNGQAPWSQFLYKTTPQ